MSNQGSGEPHRPRTAGAGLALTLEAGAPPPLTQRHAALGIDDEQLTPRADGTIVEPSPPTLNELPRWDDTTAPPPDGGDPPLALDPTRILLGPILGEGGMGIVHLADQPALRREVAVKKLRPERKTPAAINSLLREAWVTGRLEHPNIVPIHLVFDNKDDPLVVMKRVEGVTWDALLDAPDLIADLTGQTLEPKARLRFHLRILGEVCHAVHFAHARGILHLDLKPENVMVGRFGEVYLLDWGIAASVTPATSDDEARLPSWLPPAESIRGVRGTPSWMPPEMAAADGPSIGVCSDVYLLGGLLHAVLVNTPRHTGESVRETLESAWVSAPYPYPREVPAELAELANRATDRDPARRPESAEALRRAIETHVEHQSSIELSAGAEERLERLLLAYRSGDADQGGPRAFLECRFAFLQALATWPENTRAQLGLQRLLRSSANHALEHGQFERASECIAELSPPDPQLEARLETLGQTLEGQRVRLRVLERDADANAYHRKRSLLSLGAAILFVLWNVTCGLLHRRTPFTLADLPWISLATIAFFAVAAALVRRSLLSTATNRRLVVLFGSGFASVLTFWTAVMLHGDLNPARALLVDEVLMLTQPVYVYFVLAVAFTMDGRVAWLVPLSVAVAVLTPLFPGLAFEGLGLGGALIGVFLAALWWRPRPRAGAQRR